MRPYEFNLLNLRIFEIKHLKSYGKFHFKIARFLFIYLFFSGGSGCYSTSTWYNDAGGGEGEFVYLDRHNLQCKSNEAITYFNLQRRSSDKKIRYFYECCPTEFKCTMRDEHTNWVSKKWWGKHNLWKHNVDCGQGYLNQFKLKRNDKDDDELRYNYKCCDISHHKKVGFKIRMFPAQCPHWVYYRKKFCYQ